MEQSRIRRAVLCGFMGSGKTTIGQLLARELGWEFLDTDEEIQREAGMDIPAIFALRGEAGFRAMEHGTAKALAGRDGAVISTGGGLMVSPANAALFAGEDSLVVVLDTPFPVCYERIRGTDRPLAVQNTREELEALYQARRTAYLAAASLAVDNSTAPEETVRAILARLLRDGALC